MSVNFVFLHTGMCMGDVKPYILLGKLKDSSDLDRKKSAYLLTLAESLQKQPLVRYCERGIV